VATSHREGKVDQPLILETLPAQTPVRESDPDPILIDPDPIFIEHMFDDGQTAEPVIREFLQESHLT